MRPNATPPIIKIKYNKNVQNYFTRWKIGLFFNQFSFNSTFFNSICWQQFFTNLPSYGFNFFQFLSSSYWFHDRRNCQAHRCQYCKQQKYEKKCLQCCRVDEVPVVIGWAGRWQCYTGIVCIDSSRQRNLLCWIWHHAQQITNTKYNYHDVAACVSVRSHQPMSKDAHTQSNDNANASHFTKH